MSVEINITENKYYPELTQEVTEIIAEIQTGYYPVGGGGDIDWDNIDNKPTEFPPSEHFHNDDDVRVTTNTIFSTPGESLTYFEDNLNTWANGINDDISDFQNALNSKVDVATLNNYFTKTESDSRYKSISYVPTWGEITGKPTNFNPTSHNSTHENGGTDQINGQNLFVEVIPSVVNYTPYFNTLKGHLNGIDSKLGEHSDFKAGILDGSVNPLLSRSAYAIVSQLDPNGWPKQMGWVSHDDKRIHVADIETGQSHATLDDRDLKTFGVSDALIQFARGIYEGTHIINTGVFVSMQVLVNYGTNPRQITLKFTINSEANVLTAKGYKLRINNTTSAAQVNLNFATAGTEGTTVLVFTFNDTPQMEHTIGVQEFEIYKDGVDESGVPSVNWVNNYKLDKPTLTMYNIPYWNGSGFSDSVVNASNYNIGIGGSAVTYARLYVNGSITTNIDGKIGFSTNDSFNDGKIAQYGMSADVSGEVSLSGFFGLDFYTNAEKRISISGRGATQGNVGIGTESPTEKLHVNGNIRDQYGQVTSDRVITITSNTIISDVHNGAILHVINSVNLLYSPTIKKDFNFVVKAFGNIVVQHIANSGITLSSDSGYYQKNGAMVSVYCHSDNNVVLNGELSAS